MLTNDGGDRPDPTRSRTTLQYDQINHDIEPFFALSPKTFQKRVHELASTGHT